MTNDLQYLIQSKEEEHEGPGDFRKQKILEIDVDIFHHIVYSITYKLNIARARRIDAVPVNL